MSAGCCAMCNVFGAMTNDQITKFAIEPFRHLVSETSSLNIAQQPADI
jgi:hypothetical protein